MQLAGVDLTPFLDQLRDHADRADAEPVWPEPSWKVLRETGALRWSIPERFGGAELDPASILAGFERLASACLTTVFLLSQREAAVRRICDFGSEEVCERILPPLVSGKTHATVGLSQLTTSRQHSAPALRAIAKGDSFVLDGFVPWVSGASRADFFLIGATLEDTRQVLLLIPQDRHGLSVGEPLALSALLGSITAELRFDNVEIAPEEVLAGPVENVLKKSRGGGGGLETSCLALGLAGSAIDFLREQAEFRNELGPAAEQCERAQTLIRAELATASRGKTPEVVANLRVRATELAQYATRIALLAAKGTGYVHPHPAQRWARQALFFLVWSCPRPTSQGLLERFVGQVETLVREEIFSESVVENGSRG